MRNFEHFRAKLDKKRQGNEPFRRFTSFAELKHIKNAKWHKKCSFLKLEY